MSTPINPAKRERNGKWKGGIGPSTKGYPRIWAGPFRGKYLHKLIWEWTHPFDPPLGSDEDIDHVDGDKMNFHPSNLRRISKSEHTAHHNLNGHGPGAYTDECPF